MNNTSQVANYDRDSHLVRELMGHNCANSLLLAVAGLERIDEKVDLAIRN